MTSELLTVAETADILRVSDRTLRRWRLEGIGPPFIRIDRYIRYKRSDVETWLEGQRRTKEDER